MIPIHLNRIKLPLKNLRELHTTTVLPEELGTSQVVSPTTEMTFQTGLTRSQAVRIGPAWHLVVHVLAQIKHQEIPIPSHVKVKWLITMPDPFLGETRQLIFDHMHQNRPFQPVGQSLYKCIYSNKSCVNKK